MFLFGTSLRLGNPAPHFSLKDQDGKLHQLDDYKDKKLVIYFFPKADTPGWIKQACGLGISFDSKSDLKSFKEKYSLPFDLLSDTEKVMGSAYEVNQYFFFPSRKTFLINEKGILVHIFDEVNLHTHPIDILKVFKDQQ